MSDRPPFDPVRAGFYLVGAILLSFVAVAVALMGFCIWRGATALDGKCDADSRVIDLLSQALSAALAFAGGYRLGNTHDKK